MHQFLLNLDDSTFRTVISQIVNMEPLLSVNNAYSKSSKKSSTALLLGVRMNDLEQSHSQFELMIKILYFTFFVQNLDILQRLVIK